MSSVLSFVYSAPDGNQHGNDHDGSGGTRESRHDVDDAGDASNTEIGHVDLLAFSNHYRYHTMCAIVPNLGLARRGGNLGKGLSRRSQAAIG